MLAGGDEFAVLAKSFEAMRESGQRRAAEETSADEQGSNGNGSDAETSDTERKAVATASPQPTDSVVRALERAFDSIFEDIVGTGPVRSIAAYVEIDPGTTSVLRARGVTFENEETAGTDLIGASRPKAIVPVETLAEACEGFSTSDDVRAFYVHELRLLDSFKGRLWIGLGSGYESGGSYLGSTLALFASQIASLIERGYLYEQLRAEHAYKNRMLGHLFEAEAEERKRIARGIHDQTAQDLTALLLLLETFPGADESY